MGGDLDLTGEMRICIIAGSDSDLDLQSSSCAGQAPAHALCRPALIYGLWRNGQGQSQLTTKLHIYYVTSTMEDLLKEREGCFN